jgi:CPA2 family monovalent cation:H+ antiporter-2
MRRLVFGLGGAQVALTAALIGAGAWMLGSDRPAAAIIGLALALSSTAIVVQLLTEKLRLSTPVGRTCFGVLLFQDLAVVPILFLVTVLGTQSQEPLALSFALALGQAVLVIALILLVGRLIVRPVFRLIGGTENREFFMAAALLAIIGTAVLTSAAGLSLALGAFLAGLLFADTEYRHQINSDIEPFKGLLLALFFMSVGMTLDVGALVGLAGWVLLAAAGLIAVKAALVLALARLFRASPAVAAESALLLGQGGEFGFVIGAAALALGLLSPETTQFLLLTVVLTMFLTPPIAAVARQLGRRIEARAMEHEEKQVPDVELRDHVVIGGFGRVGQMLGALMEAERIPYVAVDHDAERVAHFRDEGAPVHYGDAADEHLLAHVGLAHAQAFVSTMDEADAAEHAIAAIRRRWPELPVFARARDPEHARKLRRLGVAAVIPETTEASLQLGEALLAGIGIPEEAARQMVEEIRAASFTQE